MHSERKHLIVNPAWCKGCGICVAFCPSYVLSIVDGKVAITDSARCVFCSQCELRCPDYAIYIETAERSVPQWVKAY